jgi:polysaccharide biosynthesis transport protein
VAAKIMALTVFLVIFSASLFICALIEELYEAQALLLVGNGTNGRLGLGSVIDPNGLSSLARIAETDDVLREAATKVGFERLFPKSSEVRRTDDVLREAATKGGFERLFPKSTERRRTDDILISTLLRSISAQPEGKSDLLKISFRHRDEFVNALSDSLIVRQAELSIFREPSIFLCWRENGSRTRFRERPRISRNFLLQSLFILSTARLASLASSPSPASQ